MGWGGDVGGGTKRDLIVMAVCRSNLTLSLYLSSSRAVVCVWFFLAGGGEGFCVYLLCANQHWTSQLEKLDQTLPITRLTRDVSFHLSFTGVWNHEAEWKIHAATNHCTAGSLWRSPLLQHIACGLHRQDRVNSVAVYTNISSRDQPNPCREQYEEKVSSVKPHVEQVR